MGGFRGHALAMPGAAALILAVWAGYPAPPGATAPHGQSRPQVAARASAGAQLPGNPDPARAGVAVERMYFPHNRVPVVAPLKRLLQDDVLVVAPGPLPPASTAAVSRLAGVVAAEQIDAARIQVGGHLTAVLGVDPSSFRAFAARPAAQSTSLWRSVTAGDIALSYSLGKLGQLPLGGQVEVTGTRTERLRIGAFGTIGIGGVDAVVSDSVARSLGIPAGNAMVISAPHARLASLTKKITGLLPHSASVMALVAQAPLAPATPKRASQVPPSHAARGKAEGTPGTGQGLTNAELTTFLTAALSRVGMPYVWGAAGPSAFDCSGLVQWALARAGVQMPRVAVDQARTGPQVPISLLQPGDLLFYHTDPTAPAYISHVAIYLGNGKMLQAPEPGLDVEIVPAGFGAGFADAIRVYPRVAATVAADPVG